MKSLLASIIFLLPWIVIGQKEYTFDIDGLDQSVEIIIDHWGVPHIYAQNEEDLFFAQGFHAAKDRLFQFEVWRRQATGTVAEILGPDELKRDIGTRLFKFRGDIDKEMAHYHPKGQMIISSFVRGVNAYIALVKDNPTMLPIEFELLGIMPQSWTPEVVISRHQGLLGNIQTELGTARMVDLIGEDQVKEILWFHPNDPDLTIDPKIDPKLLHDDILELYNAYRRPVIFEPKDIAAAYRVGSSDLGAVIDEPQSTIELSALTDLYTIGSNNWIVNGDHTQSGYPMMANDPHRTQAAPSLRYMSHLVAPGWNVIGGGEPEIPGISIGHNEYGAWGLTVYRTDAEDLYVYEINPDNHHQYQYNGEWADMSLIKERIPVKGNADHEVNLYFTRHGPVTLIDSVNHVAYAVRCGWLENGGSPYLASLRMNQARNFDEFREACNYSHIPGENMIWADKSGHIGWQAVGITPVRSWSGMVPVPGDGSHEWQGYREIKQRPNISDPPSGIFGTSNEHVTPDNYPLMDEVDYLWSDPYRGDRVMEVLRSGRQHTVQDMAQLQTDYLSIPARELLPMIAYMSWEDSLVMIASNKLKSWDYILAPESIEAGIYVAFEDELKNQVNQLMIPQEARGKMEMQLKRIIDNLLFPDERFGPDPIAGRDAILHKSFDIAIGQLKQRYGDKMSSWTYGGAHYKYITLQHPMSRAVTPDIRAKLEVGPAPRGGNAYTVNMTSSSMNQRSGGSFKIICDTGNWDHTLATNTPGQNGNPDHPHYRNLFELWARDQYFPLFYSKEKIKQVVSEVWSLK